ncbi:MAG: hypothetical protein WDO70_02545 [Alphaproteobacteria bacterium]
MNAAKEAERFAMGLCAAAFVLLAGFAVFFVPMNMDEAGIYHVLACFDYPFAPQHVFREACNARHDLTTPLGFYVTRSEFYVGIFHSVLYAPVYFLFHSPAGQYGFGLAFLGGFAFLLARLAVNPRLSLALTLAFFPFTIQFVHDTGPVSFATLVFPLGALLFRRMMRSGPPLPRHGYAALLALLVFLGVEEKIFFLFLLPSFILFCLAFAAGDGNGGDAERDLRGLTRRLETARAPIASFLALAFAGIMFWLLSTNTAGNTYLEWLMKIAEGSPVPFAGRLGAFAQAMLFWPFFAHKYFVLDAAEAFPMLLQAGIFSFMAFCLTVAWKNRDKDGCRALLLALSFGAGALCLLLTPNSSAGHHFIFLWVPLLALLNDALARLKPPAMLAAAGFFCALNLACALFLTQMPVNPESARDKDAIFARFNAEDSASGSIVNFASWGGYYIQALYGPKNQLVTYTEPYMAEDQRPLPILPGEAAALLDLSAATKRRLYNICAGRLCSRASMQTAFGNRARIEEIMPGLATWRVFEAIPVAKSPEK